jgi:sensor histidine kinase YesM
VTEATEGRRIRFAFARGDAVAWAWIFGAWTVLALLSATQSALYLTEAGVPVRWGRLIPMRLADWYTCAIFTPAYFWLVRRYPVDRVRWRSSVPVLLGCTFLFVVLKYTLYVPLGRWLNPESKPWTLGDALAANFINETIIFGALVAVIHAIELARRERARERREGALRAQLAEARLEALASQLHPHFLFNTLHGVSALMHRDVDAADTMLAHLGELLRRTLATTSPTSDTPAVHEIPLREELALLEHYLAVMRVRFGDRLTTAVDAAPEALGSLVPPFLLQPLVENAIEHGIARRASGGRIEVAIRIVHGTLAISISDDGEGLEREPAREGVGVSNTRRRLSELYGKQGSLEFVARPAGGLNVTVTLPLRAAYASPTPTNVDVGVPIATRPASSAQRSE